MTDTEQFIYCKYIDKILNKHNSLKISDDKFQQYLETLDLWEAYAEMLPLVRLSVLKRVIDGK